MDYKIIFLIISSDNESIYSQMRDLSPKYLDLYTDSIKYFFIENRENIDQDIIEEGNYIYIKGSESFIPGIYQKSIKAIEYVSNNYNFDFVIRTNLSTFWNIPNLFTLLDSKSKERFSGGYSFQGFISGTGIIMSKDVGIIVSSNPNNSHMGDDLAISQTISSHGIELYNIIEYKWGFLIPQIDNLPDNCRYLNITDNDFSDILNFRIKNADRTIDVTYFKVLLNKLYNINIDYDLSNINNQINKPKEDPPLSIIQTFQNIEHRDIEPEVTIPPPPVIIKKTSNALLLRKFK
jgi:hypothetical protein